MITVAPTVCGYNSWSRCVSRATNLGRGNAESAIEGNPVY